MLSIQKCFITLTILHFSLSHTSESVVIKKQKIDSDISKITKNLEKERDYLIQVTRQKRKLNHISQEIHQPNYTESYRKILQPQTLTTIGIRRNSDGIIENSFYQQATNPFTDSLYRGIALATLLFDVSWKLCDQQELSEQAIIASKNKIKFYTTEYDKLLEQKKIIQAQAKIQEICMQYILNKRNKKLEKEQIIYDAAKIIQSSWKNHATYKKKQSLLAYQAFQQKKRQQELQALEERKEKQRSDNKAREEEKKATQIATKKAKRQKAKIDKKTKNTTALPSGKKTADDDFDFLDQEIARTSQIASQKDLNTLSIAFSDIELAHEEKFFAPFISPQTPYEKFHTLRNQRIALHKKNKSELEKAFYKKLLQNKSLSTAERRIELESYRQLLDNQIKFPSRLDEVMFEQITLYKQVLVEHILTEDHLAKLQEYVHDWQLLKTNLKNVEKIQIDWLFECFPEELTYIQKFYQQLQKNSESLPVLYSLRDRIIQKLETDHELIADKEQLEKIDTNILKSLIVDELYKIDHICNNIFTISPLERKNS